ncbi:DUF4258 domain-containing protein [Ruegeria sp. HKCCA0235A]|uniref:DUF4258 domain-containing protein n=1 Tax=Ruegeria sp. HKCCA0235A TaxID=2682998 RepID=UPI001488C1B0|nr:DUF4258 domain-containing protein [Ruegeria sp. HKCCA0235A]
MIHDLSPTRHAETRMRQRGIRDVDVYLLFEVGERVSEDAFQLTRRRAAHEITKLRRKIQQIERLRGTKLIVEEGTLITVCHEHHSANPDKRSKRNRRSR